MCFISWERIFKNLKSVYLYVISTNLSICQSISMTIHLSIYLSIYLPILGGRPAEYQQWDQIQNTTPLCEW